MRDEHEPALPAELAGLEKQLAAVSPSAPRIDRDRLMFSAGAASAQSGRQGYIAEPSWLGGRFWPAATAMMTAASVVLAAMLVQQNDAGHTVAVVPLDIDVVAAADAAEPSSRIELLPYRIPPGYLGVRYVALTQGVGALEKEASASSAPIGVVRPPVTSRRLLEELLPKDVQSRS